MNKSRIQYTKTAIPFTLKSVEAEGVFSGYASVFNTLDQHGDRVLNGAFAQSLQRWREGGSAPKMLWQHDQTDPIGIWLDVHEDNHGLFVRGKLLLDLKRAQEAYTLMKAGVLDSLSIGYRVAESSPGKGRGERLLRKVDLHEISLVTFAANGLAKITEIKQHSSSELDLLKSLNHARRILER